MEHVGIVGGGLLGLSLADRLRGAGCRVTVMEAAPEVGGLAAAWQLHPSPLEGEWPGVKAAVRWDKFYHVILLSDSHTHALLRRLNLHSEFVGTETKTGFYTDGKLHSMSNS